MVDVSDEVSRIFVLQLKSNIVAKTMCILYIVTSNIEIIRSILRIYIFLYVNIHVQYVYIYT